MILSVVIRDHLPRATGVPGRTAFLSPDGRRVLSISPSATPVGADSMSARQPVITDVESGAITVLEGENWMPIAICRSRGVALVGTATRVGVDDLWWSYFEIPLSVIFQQ